MTAESVRPLVVAAENEIDLVVNSPGGSVYEGIAIFNLLRDFRRGGGVVNAKIKGLAASMATYVAMAADSVSVEDNAVWMVHNPWNISVGDAREMRKEADILDGLAKILRKSYEQKTGRDDVAKLMDDESYFYGSEIVDSGFADKLIMAAEGAESKEQSMALCKISLENCVSRLRQEPEKNQLGKVAALLPQAQEKIEPEARPKPADNGKNTGGQMTIEKLKTDHPDIYALAVDAGVKKERDRRNAIVDIGKADAENSILAEVVAQAVQDGTAPESPALAAKVAAAIRDGKKIDGENPPAVDTLPDADQTPLSKAEKATCRALGISEKAFREQKEA